MTVQPISDYLDLADYLGVLRRRWLLVLAFTIAGIALAGAYYYVAPRSFAATVLVQVNALPNNANALGGRTSGPVNMDNEGQIAQSATVAAIAASKLNSPLSVTSLLKDVNVAVPPNTTFLQITCSASTADLAQRCANAFGSAYLYNRRATALGLITSGIKALEAQATTLETSIEQLKGKVGRHGLPQGSASRGVAELQLNADMARLAAIGDKINSATPLEANLTAKNTVVGQIVTPAVLPLAPASPKKKLILPSGMAAGLLIGLVLAFFLDWRRPRIYTAGDVRRRADLPTVFDLTEVKSGAHAVFAPPRSRTGQVYTELAQYVGAALGDGHHVLLVAEAAEGSGDGTVAANLASALARTRGETVLICATSDRAEVTADAPLLRVITPGFDAASPANDIQHDKVERVMRELRREVRYVVVDVPPPSLDADTFSVAEFADAAVMAVGAGATRLSDVTSCLERLERMRTAVLAAVLLPPGHSTASRSWRGEDTDAPDNYAPEPSRSYQPRPRPSPRDEAAASRQPVIRPVSRRTVASPAGDNGTLGSAWTPRSLSESWPLPQARRKDFWADRADDEGPGASDQPVGN